jgi:3-deoxy-D-arabino-heptulosonate 7-phosphate (DAHP) synthase
MMQASAPPRYLRNPDVVLREEDEDGGLLFNPDTNQIRVLNHTGLFIWKLCDGVHNLENILDALREEYVEIPEEQVDHQVTDFMDEMVANGFIGIQTSEPQNL